MKKGWGIIIALLGSAFFYLTRNTTNQTSRKSEKLNALPFSNLIYQASNKHQVDPKLIASIIKIESNFQPDSIGDNGTSFGLMQVNCTRRLTGAISTARVVSFKGNCRDLLNPAIGIDVGTAYLARQLNKYGPDGVVAYNTGYPYNTDKTVKTGTNNYAQRVMSFYQSL
jgi:soluble lytic murein transglycosylase-like protein